MDANDFNELSREELLNIIWAYDDYVINYMDEHGACKDGCSPVCLLEFVNNEYQELNEEEE